jgi:N-acetylmuramoyl-L-alanine amidase
LEASEIGRLRPGVLVPVIGEREGFLSILTPCEARGWVSSADVERHERAGATPHSLREATIVLDPGHGGRLDGAVGPSGLAEQTPNMAIAERMAAKLGGARVFVTHAADVTAGIGFRATLANALGAHALVSLHNNADPDGRSNGPGTETYYQYRSPGSKRLAGLIYEELVPALTRFPVYWVADRDAGAKYRLNTRGTDYYALLRSTRVPAVIVESLFVSNPPEEDLLRRQDVLDTIAGAVVAGLKRYFETGDPGSGFVVPYPREPGPSGRLPSTCNDPAP